MKAGFGIYRSLCRVVNFSVLSFPLTFVFLSGYFRETDGAESFLSLLYALSIPAYYYVIVTLLTLVLTPLVLVRRMSCLVIVPKVSMDFYLFVNLFVFNIYRFHIDGIFMSILIHDFHGIGIPHYIIGLLALSLVLIVLVNALAFRMAGSLGKRPVAISLAMVLLCLTGQFIHIWGMEYSQRSITRYTTAFPYYFPVKARNFMEGLALNLPIIIPEHSRGRLPGIDPDGDCDGGFLRYPVKRVECDCSPAERLNIMFFIVESWRSDMVNERITPNISLLGKRGSVFTNHMSGGTVTSTGLFCLMYGLHPTYLRYIETYPEKYPPLLMRVMKENGYSINVYTSSNLDGFSLRKMFFNGIPPSRYVMKYDWDNVTDDRYVVSRLVRDIESRNIGSPFFAFVFLTSSHSGYGYPESHDIFHPTCMESSFLFNRYADPSPLLNRYRNSLHYIDSLFGEIMSALKQARLDRNTVMIVTSDHGEEFNDRGNGYWGHGSDFTRHQSLVPLVLYLPGNEQGLVVTRRSSHIDVAPTILKHLFKCSNVISDFSNGADLMSLPPHRGLILKSYNRKAYVVDDTVYSEGIPLDIYDLNDMERKNTKIDYREIRKLKESEGFFVGRGAGRK